MCSVGAPVKHNEGRLGSHAQPNTYDLKKELCTADRLFPLSPHRYTGVGQSKKPLQASPQQRRTWKLPEYKMNHCDTHFQCAPLVFVRYDTLSYFDLVDLRFTHWPQLKKLCTALSDLQGKHGEQLKVCLKRSELGGERLCIY